MLARLEEAQDALDQPTMDGVNSFVIAKAVRAAGVKVALSGLGGDELFAGYPSHRRAHLARRAARLPRPVRTAFAAAGRSILDHPRVNKVWDLLSSDCTPTSAYRISRRLFEPHHIAALAPGRPAPDELPSSISTGDDLNDVSHLEMSGYMTNLLLRDTDFMTMANSLEVRVPFLDKVLVRYVLRLPGKSKLRRSVPKPLLLEAMRGSIPDYVWRRRKMGFVLPFDRWMRSTLHQQVENTLRDAALVQAVGLCPRSVEMVWERFLRGGAKWSQPWSLFVYMGWCQRYGASI
jgi:asparagine synthase (glutamine-hydrolysing)